MLATNLVLLLAFIGMVAGFIWLFHDTEKGDIVTIQRDEEANIAATEDSDQPRPG